MSCYVETFIKSYQKASLHDCVETLLVYVTTKTCLEPLFYVAYVVSVSYECCKVDWDIAYIAMVVHVCCKLLFPYFFKRLLQVCLSWCYVCFTHMCASVLSRYCVCFCKDFKCFSGVFLSVSDTCFKCFICLQTYVVSFASECFESRSGVASPSSASVALPRYLLLLPALARHPPPPPSLLDAGDVRGGASPTWACETVRKNDCMRGRPDVRALASRKKNVGSSCSPKQQSHIIYLS
jgi:hypothetical protein